MFVSIMEASTKKILGTLAAVAAVGGGFYLIKKGKKLLAGAKMNFALLGFRIHKMNLQEVQFAVKLRCYNPTKAPITLAVNQVVANYKGSAVAYSTPDIKGLTIGAGKTHEPEIVFQVPYLNLMGKGLTLSVLSNTQQLKADMTFTMTISVNGETLTTTQSLSEDENMNGLALGELGIVSGPRNTQNGKRFNYLIKKANGQDTFIKNGNVIETVESCIDIIGTHFREVEELASMLQGDSLKESCRNIFNFSYNYLQYHKDDDGTEQLRTPSRSWLDGQIRFKQKGKSDAGIDCDDYSIFVGSLLKCLGIPFKLRITKYDGKKNFQHIYVIVPAIGDSEDEIVIDPVLSKFDYQKPYSFERSDFDMSPLQLAGLRGIDGITGTSALGLPISVLSGIDLAGGVQAQANHEDLIAIVSGVDFDDAINGLGDAEDATYNYLVRTRNYLLKNRDNKDKMAHVQNPDQFISMLDQAIKFWNTPQRDAVLDKLSDIEEKLAEKGLIKYDSEAIQGLAELDELDDEMDGLGRRKRRRGRFFKAIKRVGKKIGKVAKKVVKAIVRFNPLSIAIRGGLLAALRLNMFGIAKKLQYAYLPDNLASKYNIDPAKHAKLKKTHGKVRKLFKGLQGKESNLRKAILKGAKQKSSDFSLKGIDGLLADLKGMEAIGELAELGNMGAVALWMDINRGDRLAYLVSMETPSKGLNIYASREYGENHPLAKRNYKHGDINTTLIKTEMGKTITLYHDVSTYRPMDLAMRVQGTEGIYTTSDGIYLHGLSKENEQWDDFESASYVKENLPQLWKEQGSNAAGPDHDDIDYMTIYRLIDAVKNDRQPDMDIYDATTWSVINDLTERSVDQGSKRIEFPDFTKGAWEKRSINNSIFVL